MKIFVTGGAGFIGRHLVDELLKNGNKVTIFDNFQNSNKANLRHILKKGVTLVKGDITNYSHISKSISGFDAIVHLAAQIDVQDSIKFPAKTNLVNVSGTVNLLRACVEKKIKNIVAASSAAVYGNPKLLPLSENSSTMPLSPYGASKLALEHYMQAFANSFGLNSVCLRIFNAYGDGQPPQYAGVITKFMERIAKNEPPVIFGDGSNTRDFVSVKDVISSIQKAIVNIDGKKGNVYNIASGMGIAIKDLAKLMIQLSGKNLSPIHKKVKPGDIRHSRASILLAKKDLGYRPQIRLRDGLEELLKTKENN